MTMAPPPKRVPSLLPPVSALPNAQLRLQMRDVLQSAECQAISFQIGNALVDATLFTRVADGLFGIDPKSKLIKWRDPAKKVHFYQPVQTDFFVEQGANNLSLTASGGLAVSVGEFEPGSNRFLLPFTDINGSLEAKGTVVHEAVHAGLIALQEKHVAALDGEAAARIAKEWYRGVVLGSSYTAGDDMQTNFYMIAMSGKNAGSKPYAVPDDQRLFMHAMLKSHGYADLANKEVDSRGVSPLLGMGIEVTPVRTP
jgi:hypothetical protein